MIVLYVFTLLLSGAVFGMEDKPDFHFKPDFLSLINYDDGLKLESIFKESPVFERAVPKIKALGKQYTKWNTILNDRKYTKHLLEFIDYHCLPRCIWKDCFDRSIRNGRGHLRTALAAAVLGTPGAIECGKRYIAKMPQRAEKLKEFVFNIVQFNRQHNSSSCLAWPEEDVDVVRAALDMGIDLIASGRSGALKGEHLLVVAAGSNNVKVVTLLLERGIDKESKSIYQTIYTDGCNIHCGTEVPSYTQSCTALYEAAEGGSINIVDLLIKHGANVDTPDALGRTPLIAAVIRGLAEVVKKLLAAKATPWLVDGYDKTALDYAQKDLAYYTGNDQQQKKYKTIIQLLQDAEKK